MIDRLDISPYLVHFTKGVDSKGAFENLKSIIDSRTIIGSNNLIKGGYKCVCFSEAPLGCVSNGLLNSNYYSRYSSFGIIMRKNWIFSLGGRPVIYQTGEEYTLLSEELKWRHVTFNPTSKPPVDFTWEREWRIKKDMFEINSINCSIVVPSSYWAEQLISVPDYCQNWKDEQYKTKYDVDGFFSEFHYDSFPWGIVILEYD